MLNIVGFGCGSYENMTIEAVRTIEKSELVVGFKTYIDLMREYFPDKEYYENGMMQERQRCEYALNEAVTKEVSLVCSGDSGVYAWHALHMSLPVLWIILLKLRSCRELQRQTAEQQ